MNVIMTTYISLKGDALFSSKLINTQFQIFQQIPAVYLQQRMPDTRGRSTKTANEVGPEEVAASAVHHGSWQINSDGGSSVRRFDKFVFITFSTFVSKFQQRAEVGPQRIRVVLSLHG